jgi:hypothetical protein
MRARPFLLFLVLAGLFAWTACSDSDDQPTDPGGGDPGGDDPPVTSDGLVADETAVAAFASLPHAVVGDVSALRIYYGHTSHGSQLVTGLVMIADADPNYVVPYLVEPGGDLGHQGDLAWAATTRSYLEDHADETDVVIWSWCGGCSDNTPAGIDAYLGAMNQLEIDFPQITFVYMTGHLDGTGDDGTLRVNNDRIRAYCTEHEKWLFDFARIESYDPDGTFYPDESDGCGWCVQWCAEHECPPCDGCAHSHCYNCYRKGQAFWWLLGRITGWDGTVDG